MRCIGCGTTAVSERNERTAQGYRRFRCLTCGKQFNERSESLLNRTQYPSDVIALVVLWRLRYKLSLRDLPEIFLIRGIVFSHEAVGHQPRAVAEICCPATQEMVQPSAHPVPRLDVGGDKDLPHFRLEALHAILRRARPQIPVAVLPIVVRSEAVSQEIEVLPPRIAHGSLRFVDGEA
jgi:transposase-like protein